MNEKVDGASEPRAIATVDELRTVTTLSDITFYAIVAIQREAPIDAPTTHEHHMAVKHEESWLEIRARTTVQAEDATFQVDASVRFSLAEPITIPEPVTRAFIEKVAFPVLYPYIRESVHQNAVKIGTDVPLLSLLSPTGVDLRPTGDQAEESAEDSADDPAEA